MILKALYDYYERKPAIHSPNGYEIEELDYIIIIDRQGTFIDLQNQRENKRGKQYFVPKAVIRSGTKIYPNLLWDKLEYITGFSKEENKLKKAQKYNQAFIQKLNSLPETVKKDIGVNAVLLFYETNQIQSLTQHQNWQECLKISGWMSFQLDGKTELISDSDIIRKFQKNEFLSGKYEENEVKKLREYPCLITGEKQIVKRLNSELRLPGSDKNVKIVAFQKNSGFDSYGKEQAYNAPISILAENKYSAALKHLINSKTNKKILSDTTILFWSEKQLQEMTVEEEAFASMFGFKKSEKDNPDKGAEKIEKLIDSIFTGQLPQAKTNHFFILGLAPNAARISIRFWKTPSIEEFGINIKNHFDDFEIDKGPNEVKYLSLYQILSATALQYKMENVPPNLVGVVIESIIDGTQYPRTLLQQCILRIRAERNVNRTRAAIIKAYFNRFQRIQKTNYKEITMSLDLANTNVAYRIGRLFAVLEKIQEEANPGINATIRDRYYGAASSSPITVFPRLLSLKNSHLKKLNPRRKIYFERLIGDIVAEIESFPTNLALNDQAHFAVGYYHQRQDFFTKKLEKETEIKSNKN